MADVRINFVCLYNWLIFPYKYFWWEIQWIRGYRVSILHFYLYHKLYLTICSAFRSIKSKCFALSFVSIICVKFFYDCCYTWIISICIQRTRFIFPKSSIPSYSIWLSILFICPLWNMDLPHWSIVVVEWDIVSVVPKYENNIWIISLFETVFLLFVFRDKT